MYGMVRYSGIFFWFFPPWFSVFDFPNVLCWFDRSHLSICLWASYLTAPQGNKQKERHRRGGKRRLWKRPKTSQKKVAHGYQSVEKIGAWRGVERAPLVQAHLPVWEISSGMSDQRARGAREAFPVFQSHHQPAVHVSHFCRSHHPDRFLGLLLNCDSYAYVGFALCAVLGNRVGLGDLFPLRFHPEQLYMLDVFFISMIAAHRVL